MTSELLLDIDIELSLTLKASLYDIERMDGQRRDNPSCEASDTLNEGWRDCSAGLSTFDRRVDSWHSGGATAVRESPLAR